MRHLVQTSLASLAIVIATAATPATAQSEPTPEQRAAALVAQMTLEEKASQLINTAPGIARLNIPDYQWWNEGLHGLGFEPHATNFPEPIGLAATFDTRLIHQVASTISQQGRAASEALVANGDTLALGSGRGFWSPNINIFRDPRWGRGQETYGEDPFLTASMGVAYVTGIQGPNPNAPINIATPKHFAVHSGPEPTRHTDNNQVSLHDMRDTYLPAFRAAIVDGHARSIMCSYNAINGQPACANEFLMQQTLRRDWGFTGPAVSDCGAVRDMWSAHHFVADATAAAAAALRNGLDIECATESLFDRNSFGQPDNYVRAVRSGAVPEATIDAAVTRGLVERIRLGAMDRSPVAQTSPAPLATPASGQLALRAAEAALVLLKNDGILPLRTPGVRIAVVGPLADSRRALRGNYTVRDTVEFPSVLDGLRAALPDAQINYVPAGASLTDGDVIPPSAFQTESGAPGVTVSYFPLQTAGQPAPTSLQQRFMTSITGPVSATPSATRVEPNVNFELFQQPMLPDSGQAIASGYIVPSESGTYRIGVRTLVGQFRFGDTAPVNASGGFNPTMLPTLQTVTLEANRRYPFQLVMRVPTMHFAELDWQRISTTPEADVTAAAANADVIVAVVGLNSSLESEESSVRVAGFEGGDRTTLDLPEDQRRLLEAAHATGKPVIVVNMTGSAVNLSWARDNAAAIIQAWYPGEAGGLAIGRTIAGQANPAGRLPVTFYSDVSQLPAFNDYSMNNRTYRYFTGQPVYGFGYGLSYTRFSYGPVRVRTRGRDAANGIEVETAITNVGGVAGDEVAQLYLSFPEALGTPRIALRGFQRLTLAPGERRTVRFTLSPRDISSVTPDGAITVLAGSYRVHAGGGQPDSGLPGNAATFRIRAGRTLPN